MDCIITAGGSVPEDDPLFKYTLGRPKALLEINGLTMLEYVYRALDASKHVDSIYIVGLDKADIRGLCLPSNVTVIPDQGGLVTNLSVALDVLLTNSPDAYAVLLTGADIPLLTPDIVDAFIEDCQPFDCIAYYNLVTRETMEDRYPHSGRTFVKLRDNAVAGGDMALVQTRILDTNEEFWEAVVSGRKHAWRLARIVGIRALLKLLFRRLSIAEVEALASRIVSAPVRVIESPYPELAMDVDKPAQVELLRDILFPTQPS